jgi:hypothetical protein
VADGRPAVLAAAVLRLADPPALGEYPPAVNLRPDGDHSAGRWRWPTARVAAILDRIATDIDELARARRAMVEADQQVSGGHDHVNG